MLKRIAGLLIVVAAVMAVGCANQKAPAEAAIASAETAFAAVQAEADKYVPDQAKAVTDAITTAKDAVTKGDYQAALTTAQGLPSKVADLTSAIAAKKTALTATWTTLSSALPGVVQAIESRVGILSKSKKLPAGLDQAKFDNAKAGLASMTSSWGEATSAFGTGNLTDAIAKAESVKAKASEVLGLLNMPVPPALQAAAK
jgi:hypothetical protein